MDKSTNSLKQNWCAVAPFLAVPKNEQEYQNLLENFLRLENETAEGSPLESLLDLMGDIIDAYETNHFDLSELDQEELLPADVLKRFMQRNALTQLDLAPIFGAQSRVSEILSGKRAISLKHVRQLHETYGLPISLFI